MIREDDARWRTFQAYTQSPFLGRTEQPPLSFFYEIRSLDNTVLKRDGGFAYQEAAKEAAGTHGYIGRIEIMTIDNFMITITH